MDRCKHCKCGTIPAGWNYLAHDCPDCDGTGYEIEVSECCGAEFEDDSDICPECKEHTGRDN